MTDPMTRDDLNVRLAEMRATIAGDACQFRESDPRFCDQHDAARSLVDEFCSAAPESPDIALVLLTAVDAVVAACKARWTGGPADRATSWFAGYNSALDDILRELTDAIWGGE